MATSSITKNFIISGQKQVEMFADAIEASANDRTPRVPINVTYLQGADDIIKFFLDISKSAFKVQQEYDINVRKKK